MNLLLPDVASCANCRAKTLRIYIFIITALLGITDVPNGDERPVIRRMGCAENKSFLDALQKLRTATIRFVISVRPSVRPHERIMLPLDGFLWNLIGILKALSRKNKFSYNLARITGILYEDLCKYLITFLLILLPIINVLDKVVEKAKTHFTLNKIFRHEICRLWDNVEKYCRAE